MSIPVFFQINYNPTQGDFNFRCEDSIEIVTYDQIRSFMEALRGRDVARLGTCEIVGGGPQRTRILDYVEMIVTSYEEWLARQF